MLETAVENAIIGIVIDDITAYVKNVKRGRFKEEVDLDIYLKKDAGEEHLLYVKVYYGLEPYYRPWVEFFGINPINLEKRIEYFDSVIEDNLLALFSNALAPGGKIYVHYDNDIETSYGLTYNFPSAVTRLGYKLFRLGFTWFKDWYFPEGGSEGGQKLQGEKPLDERARQGHLKGLRVEVLSFIERIEGEKREKREIQGEHYKYPLRAVERAEAVLK